VADLQTKGAMENAGHHEIWKPPAPNLEAKVDKLEESLPWVIEKAGPVSEPRAPPGKKAIQLWAQARERPTRSETEGGQIEKTGRSQPDSREIRKIREDKEIKTGPDWTADAGIIEHNFERTGEDKPGGNDAAKGIDFEQRSRKVEGSIDFHALHRELENPKESWPAEPYVVGPRDNRTMEMDSGRDPSIRGQGSGDSKKVASSPDEVGVQFAQRQGKGYGVEVRLISPKLVEIEPGKIVTTTFQITNKTDREEDFFEHLNLPPDWQMITPLTPFKIRPQQRQVKIIAFSVSAASTGGRYELIYSVKSQRDYAIADSDTFAVVVLSKTKIEMHLEDQPQIVIAGDVFPLRVRLMNRGNTQKKMQLESKGNPDYPVEAEPSDMVLEGGKSQVVKLEVKTDKKLSRKITHILTLHAKEGEGKERRAVAVLTVGTEIVPRVSGETDPYHRIPAQLSVIGVAEGGEKGLQVELSGSGSLDEKGGKKIDFLLRTPDTQQKSIFGMRDEYRLSYAAPLFGISLGDKPYSLSPLTEFCRYGRGAEGNIHPGPFGAGAYYLETRWDQPAVQEAGAYLSYQMNDLLQIKGNFLNKIRDKYSSFAEANDRIYSVEGRARTNQMFDLGLEYALSDSERERDYTDNAYRIDVRGNFSDQAWYTLEKTRAGPKFFGYYNSVDYTAGTFTFPIYRKLRGNLSYRRTEENLDLDPTEPTATRETSYKGGLAYTTAFRTNFSLDYEDFRRADYLLPADYDFREKVLIFGIGQAFNKLTLQTYFDMGKRENQLSGARNEHIERFSFYGSFLPSGNQTYSLYARFGQERYSPDLDKSMSLGASALWIFNDKFTLSASYQKNIISTASYPQNIFNSEKDQEEDSLYATLVYTLPNKHSIGLKGRWLRMKDTKEEQSGLLISYTIPFGIPVSKKAGLGVLKGRIYDGERADQPPFPNVILTVNGATAVTNQQGEFVFPNLKPGTYFLGIEQNTIGLHRVPAEKLPLRVDLKEGETKSSDIAVIPSAHISGEVAVWASPKNGEDSPKREKGLGEVLMELKNGKEVVRDFTDANGKFSFRGLRPGKWTLKFHAKNLPAQHYFEKEQIQLELKPGEERTLVGKVIRRVTEIRIIDEGDIKPEIRKSKKN